MEVDFGNRTVALRRSIKNRHIRRIPPTRSTRSIEHVPACTHDSPHRALEWLAVDRPNKIEEPVIERTAAFHLNINSAVQPFDYLEHLARASLDYQIIRPDAAQLRMWRL